jgi:2-(1,2-epoxy-1,2-dihydrophenyl)acetyl-CoA isomerase
MGSVLMADEAFLVDKSEGVLTLSFNRPEQGNAIPSSAVPQLTELFLSINGDTNVRAVLIRGEGKHFSAGGDVAGFAQTLTLSPEERRVDFATRLDRTSAYVAAYLAIQVPVVAACKGGVAGGGLMYALGADYVLADETAAFVFAHQRVGLTPDCGLSFLLPKVVGVRRAAELVMMAAKIDTAEAHRIGMVSKIVTSEALDTDARAVAAKFARGPARVLRSAKHLLHSGGKLSLAQALDAERDAIVSCVGEAAFEEGVRAFVEKRSPDFSEV